VAHVEYFVNSFVTKWLLKLRKVVRPFGVMGDCKTG